MSGMMSAISATLSQMRAHGMRRHCGTLTMANSGSMLGSTPNSKLFPPPPPLPDGPAPESPPSSCSTGEERMMSDRS